MSVIIGADHYETIRRTIRHVQAQSVRDRLELIIVTPRAGALGLDRADVAAFASVRVIEVPTIIPLALALAAGVREARAPIVAFAESHAYPGPGWAEALIRAHAEPWAGVAPVLGNANPDSLTSWANLCLDYGACVEPIVVGPVEYLPGHNSSYKRDLVMEYDAELEAMMEAEILLHWALRARGYQLYLDPTIRTFHLNVTRLGSWLPERFYTGRRFAATRALGWSLARRVLYSLGSPLIPLVRLPRVLRQIRGSTRRRDLLPGVVAPLAVGLVASALGEMVGYALGAGDATARLAEMELHKVDHVTERDRQGLDALAAESHG
jgi:hypothetical protein